LVLDAVRENFLGY